MTPTRWAMVFAHPGHEILVAGMLQRYRPHLFFLTRSDSGGDMEREQLTRAGLRRLGLEGHATFADLSEIESYACALAGQTAPYLKLRDRLLEWLRSINPTAILGDAFELSNFHHDLCRVLLDDALDVYRTTQGPVANYECPFVCRTERDLWRLRLQEFPFGPFEVFELSAPELARKHELIVWIAEQRAEAALARSLFPSFEREVYRAVPEDRDYTLVPPGLQKHYDDWGRMQVMLGKHERAVLFEEHFVPIVQALASSTRAQKQAA